MIAREITITNKLGLHARAAAKLVREAGKFAAAVKIVKNGEEVDCKSILGILSLAASKGTVITLKCSGGDEERAFAAVKELIERKFDEGE